MTNPDTATVTHIDSSAMVWAEHPRITGILMKSLLTPADNPLASINLVQVPVGGAVTRHVHAVEVESMYFLQGQAVLALDDAEIPFNAGHAGAIPAGVYHELVNAGDEPVVLLTFFTPPL